MANAHWEFHFRNFDETFVDFYTHHFGCGGVPWGDGRARCNGLRVTHNPTGGSNSVYVPSGWVIGAAHWVQLILDGLEEAIDIAASILDEGESLSSVISDSITLEEDAVKAAMADTGKDLETLTNDAIAAFAASCQSVNKTPEQIQAIAYSMGMGAGSFTFIAGEAYQKYIRNDNAETNEGSGFSIFADKGGVQRSALAAFIHQGSLIYYYNSTDLTGFWH